jgi:hypothetical protein
MARLKTTQMSLKKLREEGWTCEVTEKWNSFAGPFGIRQDLFDFIDIIAIKNDVGIMAIQTTSRGHVKERLRKMSRNPFVSTWLLAGGLIEVHGWDKSGPRHPTLPAGRLYCQVTKYPPL